MKFALLCNIHYSIIHTQKSAWILTSIDFQFLMLLMVVLISDCLVVMTDVGSEVLEVCRRNVDANRHLQHSHSDCIHVRELDWMQPELRTGS